MVSQFHFDAQLLRPPIPPAHRFPGRLPLETPVKKLFLLLWRMSKVDLRLLWFALRHDQRPGWLLPATGALLLYALAPFNLAIPVLGAMDDFVLVPLALHY